MFFLVAHLFYQQDLFRNFYHIDVGVFVEGDQLLAVHKQKTGDIPSRAVTALEPNHLGRGAVEGSEFMEIRILGDERNVA